MKINVVEPKAWMLTDITDAKKQLALCAYAAGLSRGRATDVFFVDLETPLRRPSSGEMIHAYGVGSPLDVNLRKDAKEFEEAERLIGKLLNYKPHPHESVIEHGSVSFLFRCSRIATHEIVRHRLCAFTQTSTRYIEEKDEGTLIKPPHMSHTDCGVWNLPDKSRPVKGTPSWVIEAGEALFSYGQQRADGTKRESARYLLPHALSCWIQITTNFRQWRHMIRLRTSKKAAPEMQTLFNMVKDDLTTISPVLTEDL